MVGVGMSFTLDRILRTTVQVILEDRQASICKTAHQGEVRLHKTNF